MRSEPKTLNTIYLLINTANEKIYVGQTWNDLNIRMGKDGSNYKNSIYLYNAIKKYGSEAFRYEILTQTTSQIDADYLEDYYIEVYDSRNPDVGYNLKRGGGVGKHSEETKAKISATLKEQASQWTPEELAERSAPIVGWWEGKKRGPRTDEQKKATSEQMKERHRTVGHPMQDEHHTDEAKAKISKANKGKKRDPEAVKQGAATRKAWQMPPEREQAIIQAYLSGKTIAEIETELNTGRTSIYRILDRNNIPRQNNIILRTKKRYSEDLD